MRWPRYAAFIAQLKLIEESIVIDDPIVQQVKRAYWGRPNAAITDLPAFVNAETGQERVVDPLFRDQGKRINVQLLVAKTPIEDERSSLIATAFWSATQDAFDADRTLGGTVFLSTLRGAEPTVPVILVHAGESYIGFNAILDVEDMEVIA